MNMLFIKHFFVGFMVSEIPRVYVFGHCPYSVTFPYICPNKFLVYVLPCLREVLSFLCSFLYQWKRRY